MVAAQIGLRQMRNYPWARIQRDLGVSTWELDVAKRWATTAHTRAVTSPEWKTFDEALIQVRDEHISYVARYADLSARRDGNRRAYRLAEIQRMLRLSDRDFDFVRRFCEDAIALSD